MDRKERSTSRVLLRVLLLVGILVAATAASAQAQAIFSSEDRVDLIPPPQPEGSDASDLFSQWGIKFSSESGARPVSGIRAVSPINQLIRIDETVILNGTLTEDAGALVIDFETPIRSFAVYLAAAFRTDATVSYFDADGLQLGEEVVEINVDDYGWPFLHAFEDVEGRIRRATIDYANPEAPEALFMLMVDFVELPVFRSCVAQVAHGPIAGSDQTLQTQLSFTSGAVTGPQWQVITPVRSEILNPTGAISPLVLDGASGNPAEFELNEVRSEIAHTVNSGSGLETGYVCASSRYPIEIAAVYRILNEEGGPVSEAGIQGTTPGYRFFGPFQKEVLAETNTALAIANVSDGPATITITFNVPSSPHHREATQMLEPGAQGAWFVDELLSDFSDQDVEGGFEIVSDQRIVATSLRTIGGFVSSSLPLGKSRTADNQ
jgi:hypothetical protein